MDRHGQVSMQGRYDYPITRPVQHTGTIQVPLSSSLRSLDPVGGKGGTGITENLSFSFCIETPSLAGPDPKRIAFATPGAKERWLQPVGSDAANLPAYTLPYHRQNLDNLKRLCKSLSDGPEHVVANAQINEQKPVAGKPRRSPVTTISLYGDPDVVLRTRGILLESVPLKLKCATVDIDVEQVIGEDERFRPEAAQQLERISDYCGVDIFVVHPEPTKGVSLHAGGSDTSQDTRLKIIIYGDVESVECAKIRVLVMIDDMLGLHVDSIFLELSLQSLMCGRGRKDIQHVEAVTKTNIYLPTAFPGVFGYKPPKATPRHPDIIFITGQPEMIKQAARMISELVSNCKLYVKDVSLSMNKIDFIILERLDMVKKIMAENGSFVQFPSLGAGRSMMRVQAPDIPPLDRTIKAILNISHQYYNASCWVLLNETALSSMRPLLPQEVQRLLTEICVFSGADIAFSKFAFEIYGSDDAVKLALKIISDIRFVKENRSQIRVKVQVANEHKEFVSGKKNGKINKIMGQADVQILFEPFNEFDFYIDVIGVDFQASMLGLELVEQELPADISFYIPDRYHKRIIGIGGQHIQSIMRKYSVFVKFSNAMDRDSNGGRDSEEIAVDNVICRTPARNAASLELVKQEINAMVQQVDSEYVEETVIIPRLYHRTLIAQGELLVGIEKKWSCKIRFPGTETASDIVTISGPEWQVPHAIHELLAHVPETHTLDMAISEKLQDLLSSSDFKHNVVDRFRMQFGVMVETVLRPKRLSQNSNKGICQIQLTYTRDNRASREVAIDSFKDYLVSHGIMPDFQGLPVRPQSDSFEDSLPYFPNIVFPGAPTSKGGAEEPNNSSTTSLPLQMEKGFGALSLTDSPSSKGLENGMPGIGGPLHHAWDAMKANKPRSSLSDEQRERLVNELPDYLRQPGILKGVAGDRNAIYADSTADLDPSPVPFSRAVGTNPRADPIGHPYSMNGMKRNSGESSISGPIGPIGSMQPPRDVPRSRPSTAGSNISGISDSWSMISNTVPPGVAYPDADSRKVWGHFPMFEKRHNGQYLVP
ncbi:hypothetical protein TWF696_006900 [Orbilia brochopaga]|uniref:K Homology domain-containing protein n=1 Tax=Orbilia brochopaga TaxID=3140254 RepID=A0AAV9UWI3_9PEZI